MNTPTPALLKGLKKSAEKPASATTPQDETSSPPKRTGKPGQKRSNVTLNVTPFDTSDKPSSKPNTPPSSGASASTVRSHRKASSSKTPVKASDSGKQTESDKQSNKSPSTERKMGYRNQPLKDHEGLKTLQKKMERGSELTQALVAGELGGGYVLTEPAIVLDIVQSNHIPPHQSYKERAELIHKIEQGLMKGHN